MLKDIMNYVTNQGYKIYLVGGSVRDYLLDMPNHDFDLATNMPFDKINKKYKISTMKQNSNRNASSLRNKDMDIEFIELKGNNIIEDLSKRDFTINAMAIDHNNKLIDPFNGVDDLKHKIIRLVNDKAFEKDPLRILRAIRFSAIYNFEIEENTIKQMYKYKDKLKEIPKERILNELEKILLTDNPSKYIKKYKEIFFEIIPELEETVNFDQHNPYHNLDLFNHTLKVLDNTPKDINIRLAALFHDLGKIDTFTLKDNIGHFYKHELYSSEIFKNFSREYKLSNKQRVLINKLILYHERTLSNKNVKMKKFLKDFSSNEYELKLLFDLKKADIKGQAPKYLNRLDNIQKQEENYLNLLRSNPVLKTKDLNINGKDLINLGFKDQEIGIILNKMLKEVIEDNLDNSKEKLEKYALKRKSI